MASHKRIADVLNDQGTTPDRKVLLTAGLREELTQLLWEIQDGVETAGDRQLVVMA